MLVVKNKTHQLAPRVPWKKIIGAILGNHYDLGLIFVGDRLIASLNRRYRAINRPTNILAFPLDRQQGDIFINLAQARREAATQRQSYRRWVIFLFIHGLLHLKGLTHGSTMERKEREFLARFSLQNETSHHRV